jgi:hypothetical protein
MLAIPSLVVTEDKSCAVRRAKPLARDHPESLYPLFLFIGDPNAVTLRSLLPVLAGFCYV